MQMREKLPMIIIRLTVIALGVKSECRFEILLQ